MHWPRLSVSRLQGLLFSRCRYQGSVRPRPQPLILLYGIPSAILLVLGIMIAIALACGGQVYIHRRFGSQHFVQHNGVGGFIITVVGTLTR